MNIIDKTVAIFSPERALKRKQARIKLDVIQNYARHGASQQKKSMRGWIAPSGSPDDDIIDSLEKLRGRSRDLFMGAPLATGALKTVRTNVVGAGLRLNSQIDSKFLGLSKEQAAEWERNTEREFFLWADNQDCDAARTCTFGQQQSLVFLSALMNGDSFATLPIIPRKGRIYDLRVALIEADRVCTPENSTNKKIIGGIEMDDYGAPVNYHVAKHHPATSGFGSAKKEWMTVPAFGKKTGRRNVLHIIQDMERIGQRRGVPMLAPVIESLKQLTRYSEAELMAAVVSGMFTVFIKSEMPQNPIGQSIGLDQQLDESDPNSYEMGNGAIVSLAEGEDISTANPGRPNTAFDGFVMSICRQIGAALEIPYELLIKNFTASYSASRAALLEAWKMFKMRRVWLVESFCQPIYEEWLAEAVAKGRIIAPGFFEDEAVRSAWCGAEWYGPSQGQLDPLKEANAAAKRVEEGFSTRTREAAELTGENWEKLHEIRSREEELRREAGLTAAQQSATALTTGDGAQSKEDEE